MLLLLTACNKKIETVTLTKDQLIDRGQGLYNLNCISCHNSNPRKDGILGPALWGSRLELLDAKVLDASYPKDYKPKRNTNFMPRIPLPAKDIEAIFIFLNN